VGSPARCRRIGLHPGDSCSRTLLSGSLAGYGYFRLLSRLHVLRNELSFGQEYGGAWFLSALLIVAGIAVLGITSRLARRLGRFEMLLGATLVQALISLALSWQFPGASYIGHPGALSGALLLALLLFAPSSPALWIAGGVVSLLPAIFVWAPLARHFDAGMGTHVWPLQTFLLAELLIFASAAFFEPSAKAGRAAISTGLAAAIFLAAGFVSDRYDAQHPRPANAFYAFDAGRNAAYWVSRNRPADSWSAALLGSHARREPFPQISSWLGGDSFWRSSAPQFPLPLPELDLIRGGECAGDSREFELRVRSERPVHGMMVLLQSDHATEFLTLNHRPPTQLEEIPQANHRGIYFDLIGLPPEGMEMGVRTRGCGKLLAQLVERSHDLSKVFPNSVPPLPPGLMTAWEEDYYNRSVLVTKLVTF
jgi:hypothetical protein